MKRLFDTKTTLFDPAQADLRDRTYYIPCFADLAPLVKSVENVGVLNPPLLQERASGRMVPMLGRRRLQAARQLNLPEIEVRVVAGPMSEAEGYVLALWDNLGHRKFDVAATAVVVKRLLDLFPREAVADDFLPLLGIPAQGPRLERLRAIGGLDDPSLKALSTGRIQEKTAFILSSLSPGEQKALSELTEALGMNANKSAEVISHLFDLSVFQNRPILEFLKEDEVQSMVRDKHVPVPERAARLRRLIRSWKFPELTKSEQEFRQWLSTLPQSDGVFVRPVPGFESRECTVEIRTNSREEAQRILNALRQDGNPELKLSRLSKS